ncbi:MAG: agglutinin biogenesis protein MshI [Caldimonas sp.]
MFNRSSRPGWMAVDLQPKSVRIAHLVRGRAGRATVAMLREFDRIGSDSDDLLRARKELSLARLRCTTSLEASAYHVAQLPAPAVPPAEAKDALRWAIKDSIDFAVDEAIVDSMPVPADATRVGRPAQIIAVAAKRDRVRACMRAFDDAGIRLAAIDVAEVAQRNVAALYEQPDRGLAFLAFGEHGGLLTFTRNGELHALRHLDVGARALGPDGAAGPRQQLLDRVTLELQRSLDNFDRQFSQVALQRLVVAPFAGRDRLVAALEDMLSVPVEAADLDDAFDFEGDSAIRGEAAQAGWLLALGLALRQEGAP